MADGTMNRRTTPIDAGHTIGEASERLGVSVHTLRYYETAGLLTGIGRRANGHRSYTDDDLRYLDLLRCLRLTGLPIVDVRRFSAMVRKGQDSIPERLALLDRHRRAIEGQRLLLDRAAALVDDKLARYREMTR